MTSEVRTINPVNCRFFNEPRKLAFTVGIHPGDETGALSLCDRGEELCYCCGGLLEVRVTNLVLSNDYLTFAVIWRTTGENTTLARGCLPRWKSSSALIAEKSSPSEVRSNPVNCHFF